jgi:ketosteroid isomerase-like protein
MAAQTWDTDELHRAFRHYWTTGIINEDWEAWVDLFTDDVLYVERVMETMHGKDAVRAWILPLMRQYREIYGIYEWHMVDPSGRVVFAMLNRRDHPGGGAAWDFPGLSVLQYAGDLKWSMEEDYWPKALGIECFQAYEAALKAHDPHHRQRATRLDWGNGPDWTRGPASYWDHPRAEPRPDLPPR